MKDEAAHDKKTAGHFKGRAVVQYLETDAFSKIGSPLPMICGKIIWVFIKAPL